MHVRDLMILMAGAVMAGGAAPVLPIVPVRPLPPGVILIPPPEQVERPALVFPANEGYVSDVSYSGTIEPLVAALRSPEFEKREEATRTMLRLNYNRLNEVRAALAKETDAEAAGRLTTVAAHLFLKGRTPLKGDASLLGVKLSFELMRLDTDRDGDLHMTVAIAELQPGYPSAQDLRVGDRIVAMDGKTFPSGFAIEDFRGFVTSRQPGSTVRFSILREGKMLDVDVQLAGLPRAGTMNLEAAIEVRNEALSLFLAGLDRGKGDGVVLNDHSQAVNPLMQEGGVIRIEVGPGVGR